MPDFLSDKTIHTGRLVQARLRGTRYQDLLPDNEILR